jgi:hypothetical protein
MLCLARTLQLHERCKPLPTLLITQRAKQAWYIGCSARCTVAFCINGVEKYAAGRGSTPRTQNLLCFPFFPFVRFVSGGSLVLSAKSTTLPCTLHTTSDPACCLALGIQGPKQEQCIGCGARRTVTSSRLPRILRCMSGFDSPPEIPASFLKFFFLSMAASRGRSPVL